ncbi:MAG: flagellar assembly protein FliW [Clostridiaceae bacterium]|nr:flagellar assembly protein FliW [Clostridiaceae bacterium]
MVIETKDYGLVHIDPEDIVTFPDGLYAFEETKQFVLLNTGSKAGIMQLQAVDSIEPRFILLDPCMFLEAYNPIMPEGVALKLGDIDGKSLSFFVIAVIPENIAVATVNLKSPVVINFKEKLGAQVILENEEYPVRYRLFNDERAGSNACYKQKAR